jgi:hypothetical protein
MKRQAAHARMRVEGSGPNVLDVQIACHLGEGLARTPADAGPGEGGDRAVGHGDIAGRDGCGAGVSFLVWWLT